MFDAINLMRYKFRISLPLNFVQSIGFFGIILVSGCGNPESVLYSNLTERDANEILYSLQTHGIKTRKEVTKTGAITVYVGDRDFAHSVETLRLDNLPHKPKPTIPELFPSDKMFTTPTEENLRIKFALEQEIAQSLTMITGVRDARVVLVLPSADPHADKAPTSASVMILHDTKLDDVGLVPRIRRFVQNAVQNLADDHISISLFPFDGDTAVSREKLTDGNAP